MQIINVHQRIHRWQTLRTPSFRAEQRSRMQDKQAFQVQGGCEMSVESVLSCLNFGPDKRIFILRHAKEYFPGVYARRERRGSCKQYPFQCTL